MTHNHVFVLLDGHDVDECDQSRPLLHGRRQHSAGTELTSVSHYVAPPAPPSPVAAPSPTSAEGSAADLSSDAASGGAGTSGLGILCTKLCLGEAVLEEAAAAAGLAAYLLDGAERRGVDTLQCCVRGLTDADCGALAGLLAGPVALRLARLCTLDFGCNQIGCSGAAALAPLLGLAPLLKTLRLDSNCIGCRGASALAEAIAAHSAGALASLLLGWNRIGDAGVSELADALGRGGAPRLRELSLEANGLGDAGAEALVRGLAAGGQRLGRLSLGNEVGGNAIGSSGVSALTDAFHVFDELIELRLSNNQVGARGAVGLATALGLGGAARLVRLTLASNRIGPEGVAALRGVGASRAELSIALSLQLAEVGAAGDCRAATALAGERPRPAHSWSPAP